MTREEAIDCNKNLRMYMRLSDKNQPCKFSEENYIALDMAIKALEQEPILDKIRSEIEEQKSCVALNDDDLFWYKDGLNDAIEIIDKYRQEG